MAGEWDSYLEEAHRASLSEGNRQGDKKWSSGRDHAMKLLMKGGWLRQKWTALEKGVQSRTPCENLWKLGHGVLERV